MTDTHRAAAASKFPSFAEIEAALREALEAAIPVGTKTSRRKAAKAARKRPRAVEVYAGPVITVVLSGRPTRGGPSQRFVHTQKTISEFEARLEASKAARAAGLTQCVELELMRD